MNCLDYLVASKHVPAGSRVVVVTKEKDAEHCLVSSDSSTQREKDTEQC